MQVDIIKEQKKFGGGIYIDITPNNGGIASQVYLTGGTASDIENIKMLLECVGVSEECIGAVKQ